MSFLRGIFRYLPDTLYARIAAVLMLNLLLVLSVTFVLISLESRRAPPEEHYLPERIAADWQILNTVAPSDRARLARALSGYGFQVRYADKKDAIPPHADAAPLESEIQKVIAQSGSVSTQPISLYLADPLPGPGARPSDPRYALPLADGNWMEFRFRSGPPPLHWYPILSLIAAVCLVVSILSLVFARSFSRRLAAFAKIADAFGRSIDGGPLLESGPREIRLATHAFNQMQERLRRFVMDRTNMLAAISHDLRTPLTRLRLRLEFVEDTEQRTKMQCDIAEMEAMMSETLAFARDDDGREQRQTEDLDELLDDLATIMRESGQDVIYQRAGPRMVEVSPIAMRRAFGNLLDNAVKYGGSAEIALTQTVRSVTITIDDHGPGIDPAMMEQVFQPFYRLETSRSRDTGGVGLGLAVARTIIRGHGGDITMSNRAGGGLRVTVTLPT
jgi:signal transduction histidine kinase